MNNMKINYKVTDEKNVLEICKNKLNISSRLFTRLKNKHIYINSILNDTYQPLKSGDILTIDFGYEESQENIIENQSIKLEILYEDEWMLIVNKPPFMPIHPTMRHYEDTLSNGVKAYFNSINLKKKIRPVNRLDKDTSGIVIFAKCEYIQEELTRQMKDNIFKKEYLALVTGNLEIKDEFEIIELPIKRKVDSIIERTVSPDGEKATTLYKITKNYDGFCLVKIRLLTGRTHQIRVHFKNIGHPLLGDSLYGSESSLINRQALHAKKVSFIHPITKQIIEIDASIPEDINNLI